MEFGVTRVYRKHVSSIDKNDEEIMCYLLWYKSLAKTISTKSFLDYHLLKTFNNFC